MSVRFRPADVAAGGDEPILSGSVSPTIRGIRLSPKQSAAAVAAGQVTATVVVDDISIVPAPRSIEAVVRQATGSVLGAQTTITIDSTGDHAFTLPVSASGVTEIQFARHTQLISDAYVGGYTNLGGWIVEGSRLPAGALGVSPNRQEYHSVSGLFLGVSTPPASEEVVLDIRGILETDMASAGRELITALSYGEVDFSIDTPIPGQSEFTAWADGDIGQPVLRLGRQYDWTLNLRVAR